LGPTPVTEQVTSNLLTLTSFPETIHWAPSAGRDARELRQRLVDAGTAAMDWICRDGRIYSFRDISRPPFKAVCEGPVGSMPTASWATSEDRAKRYKFVDLLKHTLQEPGIRHGGSSISARRSTSARARGSAEPTRDRS
jgi:hypothetical protein